ncbi:MAG: glycoside hydrolase family 15 protein [Deltaproteobacteria bacterium]|nr:glycoside hydrolase family 15 protein [Deltaproteobacteria bacterium]
MDLVSAARRLRRPFVFEDRGALRGDRLPLAARGMIGDGFTAALVAADGAIDWLCLPRFDSPSVFARVLDAERGGSMAVRPATTPFESVQAYDPDTNVLETLFTSRAGLLRLLDFMPWANDPRASAHELHRRIDCPSGEVEVELVFDPRFDYARAMPVLSVAPNGVMAEGPNGERLSLSVSDGFDPPLAWRALPGGGLRATFTLRPGRQVWCVLAWASESVEPYQSHRPFEQLRVTRRHWRTWASRLTYDGPWRHHVQRSALVLKLLMYAPTGAVVAAPTTSLPEWPGGPRNWDYRFCWTRDAAMAIRSANLLGYGDEARDFYHFLRDAVDRTAGLQIMYTIDGQAVPNEEELPHLAGAFGSRPVRIGNLARDQVQLDTTGAIVDAAHLFERFGGALPLSAWRTFVAIMSVAERTWREPDHGMWEPRHGKRHNVHSKLMNWLAMDRGSQVARAFGRGDLATRWSEIAKTIHADICANAIDSTGQHFTGVYGVDRPDASVLQLALHGFLPDDDVRLVKTVDWVRRELGAGHWLYRYKDPDGVAGPEGAFVLCGFWLAEAYALQGRIDEASEIFLAHAEASNHLGLLSEEIAEDGTLLGNLPQAFSHLGLVNAALRIDLALRLRDEGSTNAPHLVGPLRRKAEHHAR